MKTFYIRYQFDSGVYFSDRICVLKSEDEANAVGLFYKNVVSKCNSDEIIKIIFVKELENDMIIDTSYKGE